MNEMRHQTVYLKRNSELSGYAPFPYYLLEFELSMTARVQYCLLLNRAMLSKQNGWVDEDGNVYVYYSEAELGAMLHKGRSAVQEAMRRLSEAGLIVRRRISGEHTRRIYPKIMLSDTGKTAGSTGNTSRYTSDFWQSDDRKTCRGMIGKPIRNKHTEKSYQNDYTETGEPQTRYGPYQNVILTEEQMQTLKEKYPDDINRYIEEMSAYLAANGKTYQNYEAALLLWASRDQRKPAGSTRNYDYDEEDSL